LNHFPFSEPTKVIAATKVKPATHADVIGQLINLQKKAAEKQVLKKSLCHFNAFTVF
jgi:hypothetical protein